MTEERRMFISFKKNDCPNDCITFGDNSQGKALGFGKIAIITEHSISKVLLVESLDYNLLSVSQLCEMCYNCLFTNKGVTVFREMMIHLTLKVSKEESFTLWIPFSMK
jgi:hypothetical protein